MTTRISGIPIEELPRYGERRLTGILESLIRIASPRGPLLVNLEVRKNKIASLLAWRYDKQGPVPNGETEMDLVVESYLEKVSQSAIKRDRTRVKSQATGSIDPWVLFSDSFSVHDEDDGTEYAKTFLANDEDDPLDQPHSDPIIRLSRRLAGNGDSERESRRRLASRLAGAMASESVIDSAPSGGRQAFVNERPLEPLSVMEVVISKYLGNDTTAPKEATTLQERISKRMNKSLETITRSNPIKASEAISTGDIWEKEFSNG
jgi:hypothetical protein